MKRILTAVLLLAIMLSLTVFGPTASASADFTLNVNIWDANQQEGLQKIADKWSETSGVHVKIEDVDGEN